MTSPKRPWAASLPGRRNQRPRKDGSAATPNLGHTRAVFLMVAVTLMWSIAGVVTRQLEQARSFEVTFWRSFFTVLALLVILPAWQGWGAFGRVPWRSRWFWLSGVCWSVMFTAFMVAMTLTTVANVLVMMAVSPLLTALVARSALRHPLPRRTWVAIAGAGLGIVWMYGRQLSAGAPGVLVGSAVALCVPLAAAVLWTVAQRSQTEGQPLDLVPAVLVGAVLSSLATLPWALPLSATPHDVAWLALLGGVQLAIPCSLAVVCARSLQAPEMSLLSLLEIIFGIAWAWLGANEQPSFHVLGGGLVVVAVLAAHEVAVWRAK